MMMPIPLMLTPIRLLAEQMLSGEWVVGLVAAVVSAAVAAALAHHRGKAAGIAAAGAMEVTPQPLRVAQADEPVGRREYELRCATASARLEAVERRLDTHLAEVQHEIGQLHERITKNHQETLRAIGRLEGLNLKD